MRLLLFISCMSAIVAAIFLALGLAFSNGAPQEAAVAAIALAIAVIPYVFAKCVFLWRYSNAIGQMHSETLSALLRIELSKRAE
jgi:hypothetical protein